MWIWISSSTMAGGGVHGEDAGTDLNTTDQVGNTIEMFHIFIEIYLETGGMTTGHIAGRAISGIINGYLTTMFKETGENGKTAGIGKNSTIGEFMI